MMSTSAPGHITCSQAFVHTLAQESDTSVAPGELPFVVDNTSTVTVFGVTFGPITQSEVKGKGTLRVRELLTVDDPITQSEVKGKGTRELLSVDDV